MLKWRWRAGLIALLLAFGASSVAWADSDYNQALATAPQGISLNKDNAILTVDTSGYSSSAIVNATNPATPGTQIAMVNNNTYQFGSIWSTDENYFDLTQDETASMWLYFGNQGTQAADGMAFVLQNDPRGVTAIPDYPTPGKAIGETLGVWGVDMARRQGSVDKLAQTAIQDSWALEFDTNRNASTGGKAAGYANSFDIGMPPVHIGSNYPGAGSSYIRHVDHGLPVLGIIQPDNYYYGLNHLGVIADESQPNFLSNGQWHHVTLSWKAATKQMTYTFNDKDPQTGAMQPGVSRTVTLDPAKIDPNNTGKIRWGFTGATGSRYENNLVVFESVPGLVAASTTATMTDLTQKQPVDSAHGVVSHDKLQVDYHLAYNGGRQSWSSIEGHLKLPANISYETAKITYANQPAETLDASQISQQKLTAALHQSLNRDNDAATVSLIGEADEVAKSTTVPATTSTFVSNAYVGTADTPSFQLNPNVDLNLSVTSDNPLALKPETDTVVTGNVHLATSATTPPRVTIQPVLNGTRLTVITPATDGTFPLPLKASDLQAGTNTLTLVATADTGDTSNTVTVPITVAGDLKFSDVAAASHFQTATLTGQDQLAKRGDDWRLAVSDTRGTGRQWVLDVQATPFVAADGTTLAGGPVYVDAYGSLTIDDTPTAIVWHTTDDRDHDGVYDVMGNWSADQGLLLAVNGGAVSGNYTSTITWTLGDVPS